MKSLLAVALSMSMAATGCVLPQEVTTTGTPAVTPTNLVKNYTAEDMFSKKDVNVSQIFETCTTVTLADGASKVAGEGVTIDGDVITITQEGSYSFSGTLSNGQIVVSATNACDVQIILNGVTLSNTATAVIYAEQADKVIITTKVGTTNTLSSTFAVDSEEKVDGAIYVKDDLSLNGEGTLVVSSTNGNGVVTKKDLVVASGTYEVTADGHGLEGEDSVRIASGSLAITSGKDGIHSAHDTDETRGYIYVADGTILIDAMGDGMDSSSIIEIDGGDFAIVTGGGSANAVKKDGEANTGAGGQGQMGQMGQMGGRDQMMGQMMPEMGELTDEMMAQMGQMGQMGGQMMPEMGQMEATTTTTTESTASMKGLKATSSIAIYGGSFNIDTYEDGIHSDYSLDIVDGTFVIDTGDDAIHADVYTTIYNGEITIVDSFEGIEGHIVTIHGGTIVLRSDDDGINASSSGVITETPTINIYGGDIFIDAYNTGDGVDANGNINVTGGNVLISGTTDYRNTSLDFDGTGLITGGTFIATGSTSQTRQNFSTGSTQASILADLNTTQTGKVTLTDSKGNVLVEIEPIKTYQSVLISMAELEVGETYTLVAGTETQTIAMTALQYGAGAGSHGVGGQTTGNMQMGGQTGGRR